MRTSIKRTKYKSQAVKWLAINLWQEVHLKQRLFFIAFKRVKGPQVIWSAFELSQVWRSYLRIYSLKHQLKVRKNTKAFLIRLVRLWIAPFHALRKKHKKCVRFIFKTTNVWKLSLFFNWIKIFSNETWKCTKTNTLQQLAVWLSL